MPIGGHHAKSNNTSGKSETYKEVKAKRQRESNRQEKVQNKRQRHSYQDGMIDN